MASAGCGEEGEGGGEERPRLSELKDSMCVSAEKK